MLHPSYSDLMKAVNSDIEEGEQPVVQSRYSIVIATAKRARQIISGSEPLVPGAKGKKPLSVAVEELYDGEVKIIGADETDEDEFVMDYNSDVLEMSLEDDADDHEDDEVSEEDGEDGDYEDEE